MDIRKELREMADGGKAKILQRFFKTGKGEYGEGDVFLGLTVPEARRIALKHAGLSLSDVKKLLNSKVHEHRLVALEVLTAQYEHAKPGEQKKLVKFLLANLDRVNNWDLVDLTAPYVLGDFLVDKDRKILYRLAASQSLWRRRIAIVSTMAFIKNDDFKDTLKIAQMLMNDEHDLIHKATGWMLREIGKRDQSVLEKFLEKHAARMPRTALRYAIERFDQRKRKHYLSLD